MSLIYSASAAGLAFFSSQSERALDKGVLFPAI